jgi:hypothetical protein
VIRRIATVVSVAIVVFGVSFVIARWTAPATSTRSQLVVAPAPPEAALRVRTLRGAPKLPQLRRLPAATASPPVLAPSSHSATPAPSPRPPPPPKLSSSPAAPPAAALRAQVPWPTLRRG